jgi:hypothetical protein
MTPDEEYFHTSPVPQPPSLPQLRDDYSQYFQAPTEKPSPHMIDRNLVIMIFIVFVIGLLLGKAMNPVVLR